MGHLHGEGAGIESQGLVDASLQHRRVDPFLQRDHVDRNLGVSAPPAQGLHRLFGERLQLIRSHGDVQRHGGATAGVVMAFEELVGLVRMQRQGPLLTVAGVGVDHHHFGLHGEDRYEAHTELADFVGASLLARAEEHQQLLLENLPGHAGALIPDRHVQHAFPATAATPPLPAQPDVDLRRAGVDGVLHQLPIEGERVGELADQIGDETIPLVGGARRSRGRTAAIWRDVSLCASPFRHVGYLSPDTVPRRPRMVVASPVARSHFSVVTSGLPPMGMGEHSRRSHVTDTTARCFSDRKCR